VQDEADASRSISINFLSPPTPLSRGWRSEGWRVCSLPRSLVGQTRVYASRTTTRDYAFPEALSGRTDCGLKNHTDGPRDCSPSLPLSLPPSIKIKQKKKKEKQRHECFRRGPIRMDSGAHANCILISASSARKDSANL